MRKKITITIIIFLAIFTLYNLLSQIFKAVRSADRLSQATEIIMKLQDENKRLQKQLIYVQKPDYIEQQARDKLGLAKAGEVVFVIPDEKIKQVLGLNSSVDEKRLPNWQGWLRVFFH